MSEPLYVCVHVPEFPAQALLRLRPELARLPVVVMAGDPPQEQVFSINRLASGCGVTHGMSKAELEAFKGLSALKRSVIEERAAQSVLLEAADAFTPRVEVQTASPNTFVMVLDMSGSERIFGPAQQVLQRIRKAMTALHFHARFATSANLHVALCICTYARERPVLVALGKEAEALSSLPVAALSLSEEQAERLALWGIRTLGELAALPEVELVVRLGQEGKRLRRLARGEHPHHMVPEEAKFTLEEFLDFDSPLELLDSLLFVLGPMLDQLLRRAQNRSYALASVTLRLGLDGGGEHERTIKPALPVARREVLLKLLHLDLQAHPPSAAIISVFLRAEPGYRSKVQLGLFAPQTPEPMRLDITLARIAALVGADRVGRPRLLDSHRPESFVVERFQAPDTTPKLQQSSPHAVALRYCRPPVTLPVQQDGPNLTAFTLRGRQYAVREAYGPWRRSGDWWSGEMWSHEEWDICAVAASGETLLCLIIHDLLQRHWQLKALYD